VSFLAPIWLALTAAVAVPLVLHLMRRRIDTRREFPAARYLLRAEKENIRRLRLRNLLLMLLRALAVLFLAVAAARPIAALLGAGHVPTAMAIVVDNSLSAGVIVGGTPLLSQLQRAARSLVDGAGGSDQLWLVTADGSVTGGARQVVAEAVDRLEPIGGRGNLPAAITRGAGLALAAGLPASVVVVLTDGQASQWVEDVSPGDVRVMAYVPAGAPPPNRAVATAEPRPARWSPRGAVLVRSNGADSVTFRVTLGDRTVSRGLLRGADEHLVRQEPSARGWLTGSVELAPDELRGDDIRHFAVWVGDAPAVRVQPSAGLFVREAVDALVRSELVAMGNDIEVASIDAATKLPALLLAPSDPVRAGAANRALERLGVPWRLGAARRDETVARGADLQDTPVRQRYALAPAEGAAGDTLASASGEPWVVAGSGYVLVASPLTVDATGLPIQAQFLPWLTRLLTQRLATEGSLLLHADPGGPLRLPPGITGLEAADGQVSPPDAEGRAPFRAGAWILRRGEERMGALVVNPELDESRLDRLSAQAIGARIRADDVAVTQDAGELALGAFDVEARRPLQALLIALALACLVAEMVIVRRAEPRGQRQAA
jgi:hypothetical protein